MKKIAWVVFVLAACGMSGPVVLTAEEAGTRDPKTMPEFPMGCQYEGHALCNPILKREELKPEDMETSAKGNTVYLPKKRLFFPQSTVESHNLHPAAYYLGEWDPNLIGLKNSFSISAGTSPGGIVIRGKQEGQGTGYAYDCPDLIVKANDYTVYGCMDLANSKKMYVKLQVWELPLEPYEGLDFETSESLYCLQESPEWEVMRKAFSPPIAGEACLSQRYRPGEDWEDSYKRGS